jgi:hypothetical protein
MERAKIANEKNIRESIERTDWEEAEQDRILGRKPRNPRKPREAYTRQILDTPATSDVPTPPIMDLSNAGVEKRKSAAEKIQRLVRKKQTTDRVISNLEKISEGATRKSRKTDVDNAIKELSKSNRAITNIEKLSKNNVKKDKNIDVELEHMRFAFREHTKDSYENLISSAKKKQKQSNFKAALAMHELDKRGVQPHMTDIENELSNMMQPKQKLKASDAAKLNMSTLVSPQTARVLDMTGGPARRFTPTTPTAPQVVDTRDIAATRLQRVIRGHSGRTKATTQLEKKVGNNQFTLFLTADHAVVPVPQYLLDKLTNGID